MHNVSNVIFGQKAIVVNSKKQLLILKRDKELIFVGKWDFPGGKVDVGEDFKSALKREIKEETGLKLKNIVLTLSSSKFQSKLDNVTTIYRNIILCVAEGKVTLSPEHSEFKWIQSDKLSEYDFPEDGDLQKVLLLLPNLLKTIDLNANYSQLV